MKNARAAAKQAKAAEQTAGEVTALKEKLEGLPAALQVLADFGPQLEAISGRLTAIEEKLSTTPVALLETFIQAEEVEIPQLEVVLSKLDEVLLRLGMDTQAKKLESGVAESKPAGGKSEKK